MFVLNILSHEKLSNLTRSTNKKIKVPISQFLIILNKKKKKTLSIGIW